MPDARRFARAIIGRIRAIRGACRLTVLANIEVRGPRHYEATSDDPKFRVVPAGKVPTGRVRVDMRVPTDSPYPYAPQLFWSPGDGWKGADSVRLPAPRGGRLTATLDIPTDTRRLRLDVGDSTGEFAVLSFRLRKESPVKLALAAAAERGKRRAGHRACQLPHASDAIEQPTSAMRMPLLDLYASADNLERADEVSAGPRRPRRSASPLDPGVSVVILTLDKPELIGPLLDRLEVEQRAFRDRGLRLQILVGDTGSTDPLVLERYASLGPDCLVERNLAYHFSHCNNAMAEQAACETLLFLNNDVILPDDRHPVLEMYDVLHAAEQNGVVGSCLFFEDGRAQHLGIDFLRDAERRGLPYHPRARKNVDLESLEPSWPVPAVTGACLMIRHDVFAAVGGMDEGYAAECQDIALCLAARRLGYACHIVNAGPVLHLENATRPKGEAHWPDRQRFLRHWGSYIEAAVL